MVPNSLDMSRACKFNTRCEYAMDVCLDVEPELVEMERGTPSGVISIPSR